MANYEIMIIADPKEEIKNIELLINDVFGTNLKSFKKMDRTELAYPINKSNTAQYILVNVNCSGDEVKEFARKVSISKTIWRHLTINLDDERAKDTWRHMEKFEKQREAKKAAWEAEKKSRESFRRPPSLAKKVEV